MQPQPETVTYTPDELRNFRWAYQLLVALAIRILDEYKQTCEPGEWPGDQDWEDLVDSSRSVFLHKAREEARISHDEFLVYIRAGMGDEVVDIYDLEHLAQEAPAHD